MSNCRSCGAESIWAKTVHGKPMPLDPHTYDDGTIEIVEGVARVTKKGPGLYKAHFASCPDAASHRRPR